MSKGQLKKDQHTFKIKAKPTQQSCSVTTATSIVTGGRAEEIQGSKYKGTFISIKAKCFNQLSDLQRSKYPLTDLKSIYVAFKAVINSFLLSEQSNEDISPSDDPMPEIFCVSFPIKSPSHEFARVVVDSISVFLLLYNSQRNNTKGRWNF